ncbi:MAG TPA: hypothetical protein DHW15_05775 [Bacteroidetes bacterium]|jgi:membrane-associated protease RseP (regulator of RpoE activity)|nr:MAG: hypothetical protein ABR95_12575 [Sphingobacteriales bacterium BACL12 MAG-120813-bin55]HCK21669.1 hypothetical protein [Bacteroidota bacterium]
MLYKSNIWLLAGCLLGSAVMSSAVAQDAGQPVRIKIKANVNGEKTTIDTVVQDYDAFDMDAFLQEKGLDDAAEGIKHMDIRIQQGSQPGDMVWLQELENNAFLDKFSTKVEQIRIPEVPAVPPTANIMFFNGNKAFLGIITGNTKDRKGVVVKEVVPNSAAAAAGLQEGDILLKVNDMTVESSNNLIEILGAFQPGETVELNYLRNGATINTTAALKQNENYFESQEWEDYGERWEEWGEAFQERWENWGEQMEAYFNEENMREEKAFLGVYLEGADNGVLITGVAENSAASAAGLQKGDIITGIDGTRMTSHEAVADYVLSKKGGDNIKIEYMRKGAPGVAEATLQTRKSEFLFRMDDNMPANMFFIHPNDRCHGYSYEMNEGEEKQITVEIELLDEENARLDNNSIPFKAEDVSFFPNPTNGAFNLQFDVEDAGDVIINIRDINGALVYEEVLRNFSGKYDKVIQLDAASKGNYFINIVNGDYIVTKQISVQ